VRPTTTTTTPIPRTASTREKNYEEQNFATTCASSSCSKGNLVDTSKQGRKEKWSRSRSMSPFRLLQRDGRKKKVVVDDDDSKRLQIIHKDDPAREVDSDSSLSLSIQNKDEMSPKSDKHSFLRSRSFSPFRSRRKEGKNLIFNPQRGEQTRNESSSYNHDDPSFRKKSPWTEKISKLSNLRLITNFDRKLDVALTESRNPIPDISYMDREDSLSRMSPRTQSHEDGGRPPSMRRRQKQEERYYSTSTQLSRRSIKRSVSIAHDTMHPLETSMSFESVMAYPPSKLMSTTTSSRKNKVNENKDNTTTSTRQQENSDPHNDVNTKLQSCDANDTDSTTNVDDSTFSKYDNVLTELQNQTKYKKLWKRSFVSNNNDDKKRSSTSSSTRGPLGNRPLLKTLAQQRIQRLSSSRLQQNLNQPTGNYISPYDENWIPPPPSSTTGSRPRTGSSSSISATTPALSSPTTRLPVPLLYGSSRSIVEISEGSLGNNHTQNLHHNVISTSTGSTNNNDHPYNWHTASHRYYYNHNRRHCEEDHHHCRTTTNPTNNTLKWQNTGPTSSRQPQERQQQQQEEDKGVSLSFSPLVVTETTVSNAQQITQPLTNTTLDEPKKKSSISKRAKRSGLKSAQKIKPRKKMSTTKSKSIRRLFKHPSQDDRTMKQKEDRRRNFAFMKTTSSRGKVSTAALEKTRARSKQLAEFVLNPGEEYQEHESQDFFAMYGDNLDDTLENQPFTSNGLNFAALDSESVISGYSTVYDMDTFDESSVYSNRNSTIRSGGRHSFQKDRLWSFNQSPKGNNPHYSTDMFSNTPTSYKYSGSSEAGSAYSYFGMPHSSAKIKHSTRSSAASVISTSSSVVSGPASRRLMRRGMNIVRNQQNTTSNDSVVSDGDGSQFFGKDDSSEKGNSMSWRSNMDRGIRPSASQSLDDDSNLGFTFNAFGLNEHEIDNDVNAAIAELAETNPDISMFMQPQPQDMQRKTQQRAPSTRAVSTYSKEYSRQGKGHSMAMEKEISVTSTLNKSSESENINSHIAMKKVGDTALHHGKRSDYPPNEIIGHRHKETIRNVKERIKARHNQSSSLLSARKGFQSTSLPDVASSDSEDTKSECDTSETNERLGESSITPQSDARDQDSSGFNSQVSSQKYNGYKVRKSEQSTISSEETESSNEVVQFIPRQKHISQHESLSESEKRAQSWASERLDPIVISPLLVPKSGHRKKSVTPSQKRAKEWASEHHSSIHKQFHRNVGERKQEVQNDSTLPRHTFRQEFNSQAEIRVPSPEPTFVGEDESTSFTSEDLEVQAITKGAQQIRKISEIGQRLPMPTEKVELRHTASPICQPDYEKYKSSAPTVALRKVQTNVQRYAKEGETNFLTNVKLKKVSSPAPRVEIDKMSPPCFEGKMGTIDDGLPKKELDRHYGGNVKQEHSGASYSDAIPINVDLEIMPSDEISDSNNCTNNRKLSQEVRDSRSMEHRNMSPSVVRVPSPSHKPSGKLSHHPHLNAAQDIDDCNYKRGSSESSPRNKNDVRQMSHPVTKLFASNVRENASTRTKHQREPTSVASQEKIDTPSTKPIIESHTGRNKDVLHANIKGERRIPSLKTQEKDDGASLHPVAQLFAARSKQLSSQIDATLTDSRSTDVVDQTASATASKEIVDRIEYQSDDSDNRPSLDNVASLFAKRSSLLSRSSADEPTSDHRDKSSISLAQERKQKAEVKSYMVRRDIENTDVSKDESCSNTTLKDDPAFQKYFKMLKMGFPMEVVKHALTRDGYDPSIIDRDPKQTSVMKNDSGIPLKDDPKYAKYFKMLKMGLPMGAVKNAMQRDGEDPSIMDGDHNAPAHAMMKLKEEKTEALPKDKYRRTRVHWDTLGQVKSTSVWAMVNQDPDVEDIEIDESEFAELFQAEVGHIAALESHASKKVNAVKVIDPKRANNGGIVLARLKITYEEMAVAIDTMNDKVMNVEQVQGILEYIPTKEEKQALRKYMNSSHKDSADAFDDLSECEKFMVAMMTVKHSKEKVRALLFKLQFRQCVSDLEADVGTVEKACDELKTSVRLRKLLGIVLNIGNRLNTAGPTKKGKAGAFTIESLLKLNQAKAFDKKTTFLQYIVLIVMRHNDSLTKFRDDLPSVMKADKIYWDQIENDLEEVENQLENVRKISLHEVFGKKKPSWARKKKGDDDEFSQDSMSLEEEVEALRSTRIGIFTLQAIKIVSALREQVEGTRLKFRKLLEYFGEDDRKKISPHELFEIICIFAKDFSQAKEAVLSLEKEKVKRKQQNDSVRSHSPSDRSRDSSYSRCSKR
jgi:Predicted coiled-coil domain-containing protein (DUF2360)./Formin Homology 2 Domain.